MSVIKRYSALLVLSLLCLYPAGAQDSVRVATLNLWHSGVDLRERTDATIQLLQNLNADVVGLQEVSGSLWRPNRARLLGQAMGYHHVYRPSDGMKLVFQEGLAILARAPIQHEERSKLIHSKAWPFERRFVQWAEVRLPSGEPFILMNTHFTHHDADEYQVERLEQALELIEVAATQALARDIPAVVVGDMNSIPSHLAMQALCGTLVGPQPPFRDVWLEAGKGSGITSCPQNKYNSQHQKPTRLDYVLVLQGTSRQPRPQRAWRIGHAHGQNVSDHYGIAADLWLENTFPSSKTNPPSNLLAEHRAQILLRQVRARQKSLSEIRNQLAWSRGHLSSQQQRLQILRVVQLNCSYPSYAANSVANLFEGTAYQTETSAYPILVSND